MSATPDPASGDVNVTQAQRWQLLEQLNRKSLPAFLPALVLLSLVAVLGLVGNALVLHVYGRKLKAGTTRCFVLSLALVDLVTCTVCVGGEMATFRFHHNFDVEPLCRLLIFLEAATSLTSGLLVLAMTIDRYRRLCWITRRPMRERGARLLVLGACILGGLTAAPYLSLAGTEDLIKRVPHLNVLQCVSTHSRNPLILRQVYGGFLLVFFVLCFGTLIVLYVRIAMTVLRRRFLTDSPRSCTSRNVAGSPDDQTPRSTSCCGQNAVRRGPGFLCCLGNRGSGGGSSMGADKSRVCCCQCNSLSCCCRPLTGSRGGAEVTTVSWKVARNRNPAHATDDAADTPGDLKNHVPSPANDSALGENAMNLPTIVVEPCDSLRERRSRGVLAATSRSTPDRSTSSQVELRRESCSSLRVSLSCEVSTSSLEWLPRSESDDVADEGVVNNICGETRHVGPRSDNSPPRLSQSAPSSPRRLLSLSPRRTLSRYGAGNGRTTQIIIVIGVALMLSYVPFLIVALLRDSTDNFFQGLTESQTAAFHFFLRSYFIQAAVNPIIYGFLTKSFRSECKKLFSCH